MSSHPRFSSSSPLLAVLCVSMWMSCRMSPEEVQSESEQLYKPPETEKFPTKDFLLARSLRCVFFFFSTQSLANISALAKASKTTTRRSRGVISGSGRQGAAGLAAHPLISALRSSALPARRAETSREEEEEEEGDEKSRFAVTVALNVGFGRKCRRPSNHQM